MVSDRSTAARITALTPLLEALRSFRFHFAGDDADAKRVAAADLLEYRVVPRLRDREGSLVIAVVGQSGSGKSTLVNSLAHRAVSPAGPLRPTTTVAHVWHGERLPETARALADRVPVTLEEEGRPPPDGLVLIDTPEPSAHADGVPIAAAALEVADVCLFVASPGRYADAAGWELLELAARRGMPSIIVLNRLPAAPDVQQELLDDFAARLTERGLVDRPAGEAIVAVAEGPRSKATSGLPHDWVTGLRKEVEALADPMVRRALIDQGIERDLRAVDAPLATVRARLVDEAAVRSRLLDPLRVVLDEQSRRVTNELDAGAFADLGPGAAQLAADLAAVLARRASGVARSVAERWAADPAGSVLLEERPDLWSHGDGFTDRARRAVVAWSGDLPAVVAQAASRRMRRRRRADLGVAVARWSVDPGWSPPRRIARGIARLPGVVEAARGLLADALVAELEADGSRFVDTVGDGLPDGILDRLRLEQP
jgi:energy-coupling factor transporter ATP-binding protein EcfA2